jgi:GNAT superfamily N-acetyltransferase
MTYEKVANGEIATIVTFLEMRESPEVQTLVSPLLLRQIERPQASDYRTLFRMVGSRWLWFSRLLLDDEQLAGIVQSPAVELYVVEDPGRPEWAGMLELDFREPGECELAYVGLIPELSGQGFGRWLLSEALDLAWRDGVNRVHVHTCTLDHPAALAAYRRAGFRPYRRAIERFSDPRLLGILPRECAPQIPLIG